MQFIKHRSAREWLSSLPTFILLVCVLAAGTSSYTHSQLLKIGSWLWSDYTILRDDISKPTCNAQLDIGKTLNQLAAEASAHKADETDLLSDESTFNREAARISLEQQRTVCEKEHQIYAQALHDLTPAVKGFRAVEAFVAWFGLFVSTHQQVFLLLLLWVCALTATLTRHHIAFRSVTSQLDFYVSNSAEAIAHGLLLLAAWRYRESTYNSGLAVTDPEIYILLIMGFASLLLANLYQLIKAPALSKEKNAWSHALLTIPLYAYMSFIAVFYFFFREQGYLAGIAILFGQLLEQAKMFLNVALYIWVGMLLKDTRLGVLVFEIFAPWKLPAELLALVAILVMAVPTAYTGASGIVVVAMGGMVYQELRRVGARRQLALAATAMTGSSGVVLYPCLLAVLIAALDKEVVTDQLYAWGGKVFLLNAIIFFAVVFATKKTAWHFASSKQALKPSLAAAWKLIPYVVIAGLVAGSYRFFLNIGIDEFSAPIILPMIIIAWLLFEKIWNKKEKIQQNSAIIATSFERTIRHATTGTTVHIGSLILLMGLSFVIGGVIGRSQLFDLFPLASNLWLSVSYFLVALVIVGMVMDPFGAVVLVASLAPLAYKQGIHPVHFWMMTLVAFELGYLCPPVALNRLLTRQAVGDEETALAFVHQETQWWYKHEYWLLPLVVMGSTLLMVTYLPLFFGY